MTHNSDRSRKRSLPRGEALLLLWHESFGSQTYIQVGSRQVGPFQIGAAQVSVCQIAAAEISHLEIDVSQVEPGEIGPAEIKTLKQE